MPFIDYPTLPLFPSGPTPSIILNSVVLLLKISMRFQIGTARRETYDVNATQGHNAEILPLSWVACALDFLAFRLMIDNG